MLTKPHTKKKIAFFIQDFAGGGAERMIINLANGIANKGEEYSVDLLVVRSQGPFRELVDDKINIITIGGKKVLFSIWQLRNYIKKESPEVLYSTLKHVNIAAVLANMLAGNKTKTVIREACHLLKSGNKQILQKVAYRLVPFFYKKADDIVAVSKGVASSIVDYCNIPFNELHILPNPSITDELFIKAKESPDHPFFKEKGSKIILGVGRLTYQKNFDSLIKAFSIVRRELSTNTKLIILGEEEEREILVNLIKELGIEEEVSLPGFVDNPYSYMNEASVFVLSSRFEGSPNVLVEAMACGANVVSTDCPSGPREILNDGEFGKLVPIEEVKALANAIMETIKDSEKIDNSVKLRDRAMNYHVDTSVNKYLNLLD